MPATQRIVKVGGSVLRLPDLGPRLRRWLDREPTRRTILVVGGGPFADAIRELARAQSLDEERCHWLAIDAMSLASAVVVARCPNTTLIRDPSAIDAEWQTGQTPVLDPGSLLRSNEPHVKRLPHTWRVTSDSIAACIAQVTNADELVLLKSCQAAQEADWQALASAGVVDEWFPEVAAGVPIVRLVNFLAQP
jgi:aspartokinase-like uncharacterized kinase